jgi:hypothetical protein
MSLRAFSWLFQLADLGQRTCNCAMLRHALPGRTAQRRAALRKPGFTPAVASSAALHRAVPTDLLPERAARGDRQAAPGRARLARPLARDRAAVERNASALCVLAMN